MIKVGLVDDHYYDLEKLKAIISRQDHVDIVFSTEDAEQAYKQIKKNNIELLITDIEMPKLSGYELADLILSHALDISVIFVTAHSGYAVHAFELNVSDYIMKPYSKERLLKSLDRYQKKNHNKMEQGKLVIHQKSEMHVIDKQQIIFVERTGRSTTIVTTEDHFTMYEPLSSLEHELTDRHFLRSHRSYIINIHFVKHFSIYSKNSYTVSFYHTDQKAFITKQQMNQFQATYF